jgi:hypothetical protein
MNGCYKKPRAPPRGILRRTPYPLFPVVSLFEKAWASSDLLYQLRARGQSDRGGQHQRLGFTVSPTARNPVMEARRQEWVCRNLEGPAWPQRWIGGETRLIPEHSHSSKLEQGHGQPVQDFFEL